MQVLPEIKFIKHADLNKIKWDQSLEKCANANPYAISWHLDAVTGDSWDALVSFDYSWLMPLPFKKKFGIKYLPTPLFVQQLGIFGPGPFTSEITDHFFKQVEQNVNLIEFQINHFNAVPTLKNFTVRERCNLVLPLPEDRDQLMAVYSENRVRNIRKAEKNKLRYGTSSIRSIINLFRASKESQIENWKIDYYNILERAYNVSAIRDHGFAVGIYNANGILLAGAFIVEWKGRAIFLFSGNSEEGKATGAMPAMIHNYMLNAAPSIKIFDFEGSDDPGLQSFYKSFGAVEANYVHLKLNTLPFFLRWWKS